MSSSLVQRMIPDSHTSQTSELRHWCTLLNTLKNWGQLSICPVKKTPPEQAEKVRQSLDRLSSMLGHFQLPFTFWTEGLLPVASLHFTPHFFQDLAVCLEKRMPPFFPKAVVKAETYLLVCHRALFIFASLVPGLLAAVTSHRLTRGEKPAQKLNLHHDTGECYINLGAKNIITYTQRIEK